MIIEDLTWQHYAVPFRVPFTTSQGLERSRRGILSRRGSPWADRQVVAVVVNG
jgi:hypothetical protein